MKKLIFFSLAALLLASTASYGAVTYTLTSGTLTISGTDMPNYNGATGSPPWYASRTSITKVVINSGVTSIGDYAFYNCTNLTSVTIPTTVTKVGAYAFRGCTNLTSIALPNSVVWIDYGAFYGCSKLASVTMPPKLTMPFQGYTFYNCTSLTSIIVSDGAFNNQSSIQWLSDYDFYGCSKLTSVTLPAGLRGIGQQAFRGCTSLASISFPSQLYYIGTRAFQGCTQLTSVILPASITTIETYAFTGCKNLASLTVLNPTPPTTLGANAFSSTHSTFCVSVPMKNYLDYYTNTTWRPLLCPIQAGYYVVGFEAVGGSPEPVSVLVPANTTVARPAEDPSRAGSVFDDWYTSNSYTLKWNFNALVGSHMKLYAGWKVNITFNATGGSVYPTSSIAPFDGKLTTLPTPTRNGYNFLGWFTAASGGTQVTAGANGTVFTANTTIYARWEYTITFNANGGTVSPTTAKTNINGYLSSLPTPTKSGSEAFSGWFTASNGGTKVTTSTNFTAAELNANITLYAQWWPSYTITFNANGGSVSTTSTTTNADRQLSYLPTPTRNGYTFLHWYPGASAFIKVTTSYVFSANTTLYALWYQSGSGYLITLDTQGGTLDDCAPYIITTESGALSTSISTPTRAGYIFVDWFTAPSGGSRVQIYGGTIFTENTTIYAQWVPEYTITFDANGGTVSPTTATTNTGRQLSSLPTPTHSNSSLLFRGWYTAASGGIKIAASTGWQNSLAYGGTTFSANTTVYAQWAQSYTITFNANGGTVSPTTGTTNADYRLTSLPTPTHTSGYTFRGWYTALSAGNRVYANSTTFSANTTVYALWQVSYTVTFNANGGTVSPTTATTDAGTGQLASLPTPTRNGYFFWGWYTAASGGTQVGAYDLYNSSATVFGANTTIYTQWLAKCSDVNFDGNLTWNFCNGLLTIGGTGAMTNYDNPPDAPWERYGMRFQDSVTRIVVGDNVTSISGFYNMINLTEVTIGSSVTNIGFVGSGVFYNCKKLTSVTLPNSVTSVGNATFSSCTSLAEVTLSNSLTNIGNNMFYGCTSLASITIPSSVTTIETQAFRSCTGLTSVTLTRAVPPTLGANAFQSVHPEFCVSVPPSSYDNYRNNSSWKNYLCPTTMYTVTFMMNDGTDNIYHTQSVEENGFADLPGTTPSYEDYDFGGWYKEASCENAWDFNTDAVTSDTTLYAQWIPVNGTCSEGMEFIIKIPFRNLLPEDTVTYQWYSKEYNESDTAFAPVAQEGIATSADSHIICTVPANEAYGIKVFYFDYKLNDSCCNTWTRQPRRYTFKFQPPEMED